MATVSYNLSYVVVLVVDLAVGHGGDGLCGVGIHGVGSIDSISGGEFYLFLAYC